MALLRGIGMGIGDNHGRADLAHWGAALYRPCKTAGEWLLALIMLMLAAPLVVGAALLVKMTSGGPIFYHQVRLGRHGRPYTVYKIRTMVHQCEAETGAV